MDHYVLITKKNKNAKNKETNATTPPKKITKEKTQGNQKVAMQNKLKS